jgi:hypothetical protein
MAMESERAVMPDSPAGLAPRGSFLVLAGTAAAMLLGGTVALWAHYGTAVFYEMIVSGLAACL